MACCARYRSNLHSDSDPCSVRLAARRSICFENCSRSDIYCLYLLPVLPNVTEVTTSIKRYKISVCPCNRIKPPETSKYPIPSRTLPLVFLTAAFFSGRSKISEGRKRRPRDLGPEHELGVKRFIASGDRRDHRITAFFLPSRPHAQFRNMPPANPFRAFPALPL